MYSSLIHKWEKARRYAQERDRIRFRRFTVAFQGEHDRRTVSYEEGRWDCTCDFFAHHGACSHTLALQMVLEGMVEPVNPAPIPRETAG